MARPEKGFQFFRRRGIMGLPRKGTETRCRPRLYLTTGFQLIPARGRKPINEPVFASQAVISTYPRKGTETCSHRPTRSTLHISTYPRKGTETTLLSLRIIQNRKFQLIPARGRKPHRNCIFSDGITNFNLSPQGDGNRIDDTCSTHLYHFNLSPQGDGNLCYLVSLTLRDDILTYPRKGTETDY